MNTKHTKSLRETLARYYPDAAHITPVLRDAGVTLHRVNLSGTPATVWYGVLDEAEKSGLLDAVIARAHQDYPAEPEFGAAPAPGSSPVVQPVVPASQASVRTPVRTSVRVFISYAHVDEEFQKRLLVFLKPMMRDGLIGVWNDRDIMASEDWREAIDTNLEQAQVVLLLVSPDFLASDYCYEKEMKRAMERHAAGETRVVPIILRPCAWKHSPFERLMALPRDAKPVTQWGDRDEAFANVESELRRLISALTGSRRV